MKWLLTMRIVEKFWKKNYWNCERCLNPDHWSLFLLILVSIGQKNEIDFIKRFYIKKCEALIHNLVIICSIMWIDLTQ